MKRLTRKQVFAACLNYDFLKFRTPDGCQVSINAKIAFFKRFTSFRNSGAPTRFISYEPIDFMEYLRTKDTFFSHDKATGQPIKPQPKIK